LSRPEQYRPMQNIDQALSIEVKKEIADRYFGFRKLIEEDIQDFDDRVIASFYQMEKRIGFDLVRLYILLKDDDLIHAFFQLIGLEEKMFFDPYLTESPTIRRRVLAGQNVHGLTRYARFRNLVFDTYTSLLEHIEEYRKNLEDLAEERETIAEEIKLFYRKNDLPTIMGFLRSLGGGGSYRAGSMEGGLNYQTGENLDRKMRVEPPPPVGELLPVIPQPPPLAAIKGRLKKIIDKAYERQGQPEPREMVR